MVLDGDRVDETATAALRAARRGETPCTAPFDFGPARREHERRWPPALQDAFIELLMSLPAPYRAYVRRTLYARVERARRAAAGDPGRPPASLAGPARLDRARVIRATIPEAPSARRVLE